MDDLEFKDLSVEEVPEKENEGMHELVVLLISAIFITIALLSLPVFTKYKSLKNNDNLNTPFQVFTYIYMIVDALMILITIIIPLRQSIVRVKYKKEFNAFSRIALGLCGFTIFVCAFMLFFAFLLVF